MSDSNRVEIGYILETTPGQTPATPELKELRFTSESLNNNIQNVTSSEIRSDRQVTDLVQVAAENAGDINGEMSYETFDDFFIAALMGTAYSTAISLSAASDIAADATGFTATTSDFTAIELTIGQWFRVEGFVDTTINTYYQALTIAALDLNTTPVPLATEAAGPSITFKGQTVKNGTDIDAFTIEKSFLDITQFHQFLGCQINTFSISLAAQEISTVTFGFLGRTATRDTSTIDNDSTYTAANTNPVMNGVSDVKAVYENGNLLSTTNCLQSITVDLNNNLRQINCVGKLGLSGIGTGKADVTGTFTAYFDDEIFYEDYLNSTETSLAFVIEDSDGNAYVFDLPRVKFESGVVVAGGQDQDVVAEIGFRALRDATFLYTYAINKVPV